MTIIDCHIYRDGGTILIDTDNGRYWLPHHSIGIWKGEKYFEHNSETILIDNEEEISNLIKALAKDSESLQWIKRHVKT